MQRLRVRFVAFVAAVLVTAVATLFGAPSPAGAVPGIPERAPGDLCTTSEWQNPANFQTCVDRLKIDLGARLSCLDAPTPSAPDSGMAGWFASKPDAFDKRREAPIRSQGVEGWFDVEQAHLPVPRLDRLLEPLERAVRLAQSDVHQRDANGRWSPGLRCLP